MKSLIIAEKSSVASDIARALGGFSKTGSVFERDDLVISSAVGHLVALSASAVTKSLNDLPVIPEVFDLDVIERTADQFNVLKRLMGRSDVGTVINACDAGREGELIFRLIARKAGCTKPVKRMWVQSMTADSLRDAFEHAKSGRDYDALADAAVSRSEADWIIGINASRGLSMLRQRTTGRNEMSSAGRVQTPTLALVVRRELEIETFVSKPFWEIQGTFSGRAGQYFGKLKVEGDGAHRFARIEEAQSVLDACLGKSVEGWAETSTERKSKPPRLFDLTTLQREANKRFGLSAKQTLDIAQSLYESHKMTTYPRTDSNALPEDYVDAVKSTINKLHATPWGKFVTDIEEGGWVDGSNRRVFDNSKISDHFAIIPTGEFHAELNENEKRIYTLIARRFLSVFFPDALSMLTRRETRVSGRTFVSSGTVVVDPGWMQVLRDVNQDGQVEQSQGLVALEPDETPLVDAMELLQGKTQAPARYTEDSLLGAMESAGKLVDDEILKAMKDKGLGTPATRASIIETLLDDGGKGRAPKEPYLRRDKKQLVPTPKARELIAMLQQCEVYFLTSAQTTGEWEAKLNRMARGEYERKAFMSEIGHVTTELIDALRREVELHPVVEHRLQCVCPMCSQPMKSSPMEFSCTGCDFKHSRTIARRALSDDEFSSLMRGEVIGPLDGFYSTEKRKSFTAGLKWEEGKLKFAFAVKSLDAPCPKCKGELHIKPMLVECSCGFKVWRTVMDKKLTDAELNKLVAQGSLKTINGLKSKAGKVFSAGLKLDRTTGRTEIVFDKR